jgi:cytochrome c oxidase assembly protein subunit 15
VHVESSAPARLRVFEVTPARFRTLAFAAAGALYVIVSTGATVRLTGSGLGCEHWPGCQPGNPFPEKGYHSYIEFGNRMVAGTTIVLTLVAWLAARRVDSLPRWVPRAALAVFVGTLLQAPLGALAVYVHLHPVAVIPHLLLSMLVLGAALLVALEAVSPPAHVVPEELRRAALVLVGAAFALVVTGTFATAAGPHSGGDRVARFGRLDALLPLHAAGVAVFGLTLVFLVGYLAAQRRVTPLLFRLAVGLVALLLLQMGLGELQYRTHLPWWLVLVHVAVAAAVWGWTVVLAALLRRTAAPLAVPRSGRAGFARTSV